MERESQVFFEESRKLMEKNERKNGLNNGFHIIKISGKNKQQRQTLFNKSVYVVVFRVKKKLRFLV